MSPTPFVAPTIPCALPGLIAVTGAAGFIGSRVLEVWAQRVPSMDQLLAVDHPLVDAKRDNLTVAPGVPFLEHTTFIDRLERGELDPQLIIHLGACSSTTETSWDYLADNNLRYSQRLWNWCAQHKRQLIYASSAATYGDGSAGFDDEAPIQRLQPLNLYGKSKHDFDLWVEAQIAAGKTAPQQSVGLKFFNVFGPGESHKGRMASMVFHGWHQIQERGTVRLFQSHRPEYGDGGQLRDFISVSDVVSVIGALAERPQLSGLFNLGTGRAESFRTLIEAVFYAMGREPQIEYIPMPSDLRGKYQYFTEATMAKLARVGLNYSPTNIEEAVGQYVAWLRNSVARKAGNL
jgi:ADP-L-glycero-D-manno-heptose 6-epimerase